MIDLYCERMGPGLLAEPLNLASNVAYLAAAWAIWRMTPRVDRRLPMPLLAAMAAAVGLGSSAFHAWATPTARVFDELPIVSFESVFIWLYGRRVLGWSSSTIVALVGLSAAVRDGALNGSLSYLASLSMMAILGIADRRRGADGGMPLGDALAVFAVAIVFRSIDLSACDKVPVGTHFMWHVLTAMTLVLATRTLVGRSLPGVLPRRAHR
jgi:hypothetical protein